MTRRLHVLILGRDAARRRLLRAALVAPDAAGPRAGVRITEVDSVHAILPRPGSALDAALLCLAAGEDQARVAREVVEWLPHVPLVFVSDEPRPDAHALVAWGVEDHVPVGCCKCAAAPRLHAAIRWAIERRELFEKVERLRRECEEKALHDPLTGLANRLLLRDRLQHLLVRNARKRRSFALLFVDLDGFKSINDELGHAAGDGLLVEIARRLSDRVRAGDTLARWGGDEFLVLLEDVERSAAAFHVAKDLLRVVAEPLWIGGRRVRMRASIGISRYPQDGRDADALVRAADEAMYAAKEAGGGRIRGARAEIRPPQST